MYIHLTIALLARTAIWVLLPGHAMGGQIWDKPAFWTNEWGTNSAPNEEHATQVDQTIVGVEQVELPFELYDGQGALLPPPEMPGTYSNVDFAGIRIAKNNHSEAATSGIIPHSKPNKAYLEQFGVTPAMTIGNVLNFDLNQFYFGCTIKRSTTEGEVEVPTNCTLLVDGWHWRRQSVRHNTPDREFYIHYTPNVKIDAETGEEYAEMKRVSFQEQMMSLIRVEFRENTRGPRDNQPVVFIDNIIYTKKMTDYQMGL